MCRQLGWLASVKNESNRLAILRGAGSPLLRVTGSPLGMPMNSLDVLVAPVFHRLTFSVSFGACIYFMMKVAVTTCSFAFARVDPRADDCSLLLKGSTNIDAHMGHKTIRDNGGGRDRLV